MQITDEQPSLSLERALEGLQAERQFCVKRLEAALEAHEAEVEIDAYMLRINSINSLMIRLAGVHIS